MPRKPCKHVTYWCMQRSSYWGAASTRQKCYTYSKSAKTFMVFLALIASLCDMPDAALADCSGCPVAREAVQNSQIAPKARYLLEGTATPSQPVAPKCEMFHAYVSLSADTCEILRLGLPATGRSAGTVLHNSPVLRSVSRPPATVYHGHERLLCRGQR